MLFTNLAHTLSRRFFWSVGMLFIVTAALALLWQSASAREINEMDLDDKIEMETIAVNTDTPPYYEVIFTIKNVGTLSYQNLDYELIMLPNAVSPVAEIFSGNEVFNLLPGESTQKTINYDYSEIPPGEYRMWIEVSDENNKVISVVGADEQVFNVEPIEALQKVKILAEECVTSDKDTPSDIETDLPGLSLTTKFETIPGSTGSLSCPVENTTTDTLTLTPYFAVKQTHDGELVGFSYPEGKIFELAPLEKRVVTFQLPDVSEPGDYTYSMVLADLESFTEISNIIEIQIESIGETAEQTESEPVPVPAEESQEGGMMMFLLIGLSGLVILLLGFWYIQRRHISLIDSSKPLLFAGLVFFGGLSFGASPADAQTRPACAFTADTANHVYVHVFSETHWLSGRHTGIGPETGKESRVLPTGAYSIRVHTWDGYSYRASTKNQPREIVRLNLWNSGGAHIASTGETSDLADGVREAARTDVVSSSLYLNGVSRVSARNAAYLTPDSSNSVNAICAQFTCLDCLPPAPARPSISSVNPGLCSSGEITVQWNHANHAASYQVRSTRVSDGFVASSAWLGVSPRRYIHGGTRPGEVYSYQVRARNARDTSAWSLPVTQTAPAVCDPPTNLSATTPSCTPRIAAHNDSGSIMVDWGEVTRATSYDLRINDVDTNSVSRPFEHIRLDPNSTHRYQVRARFPAGHPNYTTDWSSPEIQQLVGEYCAPWGWLTPEPCVVSDYRATCQGVLHWETEHVIDGYITRDDEPFINRVGGTIPTNFRDSGFTALDNLRVDEPTWIELWSGDGARDGDERLHRIPVSARCESESGWAGPECVPDPELSIDVDSDFVRRGNITSVNVSIQAEYNLTCELFGATDSSPYPITYTGDRDNPPLYQESIETKQLQATQEVRLVCTADAPYDALVIDPVSTRIEVIPNLEER